MSERWSLAPAAGALADAWAELRVHKLRVLLSLIGIAVAVGALTAVVALGELQRQVAAEQSDRFGGRIATIMVGAYREDGAPMNWDAMDARFDRVAERYNFSRTSRIVDGAVTVPVQLPEGVTSLPARLVDPDYAAIHRLALLEGRWFVEGDTELLAPPVVISEGLWDTIGRKPIAQHPTLTMTGDLAGTYQVVGVTPRDGPWDAAPRVDLLYDTYRERLEAIPSDISVMREIWVPVEIVGELGPVLAMDLRAGADPGLTITVNRTDWGAQAGFADSALVFQLVTGAIAGIVLLLGALSLINIQLVAMRQRIREIGVRRSFGATSGRIFTSVFLENVVATTIAGAVGIVLVVLVMRSDWVIEMMFPGIQDVPPFPFSAAVTGLIASVVVGAIAGLIPALVALRVKVIDAIRF
jgi:putative ABC transport system permease protein